MINKTSTISLKAVFLKLKSSRDTLATIKPRSCMQCSLFGSYVSFRSITNNDQLTCSRYRDNRTEFISLDR